PHLARRHGCLAAGLVRLGGRRHRCTSLAAQLGDSRRRERARRATVRPGMAAVAGASVPGCRGSRIRQATRHDPRSADRRGPQGRRLGLLARRPQGPPVPGRCRGGARVLTAVIRVSLGVFALLAILAFLAAAAFLSLLWVVFFFWLAFTLIAAAGMVR